MGLVSCERKRWSFALDDAEVDGGVQASGFGWMVLAEVRLTF